MTKDLPANDTFPAIYRSRPWLISFPRSGLHWIRYILEYASERRTPGYPLLVEKAGTPREAGALVPEGNEDAVVFRIHDALGKMPTDVPAVLLLRHYRECIVRQFYAHGEFDPDTDVTALFDTRNGEGLGPATYFENLEHFDAVTAPKIIIYYEQMMSDPAGEIRKLTAFLKLRTARAEDLLDNLEDHRRRSVEFYNGINRSYTSGDPSKLQFWTRRHMTERQRRDMDSLVARRWPGLVERYLKRYSS